MPAAVREYDPLIPEVYRIFLKNVQETPSTPAIIDDRTGRIITYGELHITAAALAVRLKEAISIVYEEPICILMGRCVEQIVAQIAVIQINGSCVPIDPDLPFLRRETTLSNLGTRCILSHDPDAPFCIQILLQSPTLPFVSEAKHTLLDQCTHILHTSGTTGQPKAVRLPARGLLRHVSNNAFIIAAGDCIAHMNVPYFDSSLHEVWGTFLAGATLVVLGDDTVRDHCALQSALKRHRVCLAFITTALFNSISLASPTIFSSLRTLLVGGEKANPVAMERVLSVATSSFSLINVYGPTECSTYSLAHKVDLEEARSGRIPIGTVYDCGTIVRVINSLGNDVKGDEKGELYIGGEGLARDYWNQPKLNARKFVWLDGQRWFRTGDEVWWRNGEVGGVLEYVGRIDNQVKLRGFRFELEEVEGAILNSGLADAAAAIPVRPKDTTPILIAYVVPRPDRGFDAVKIKEHLQARLPEYMVPRIERCDELPMTKNGKVDRKELEMRYMAAIEHCVAREDISVTLDTDPVKALKRVWRAALSIPTEIDLDDNFFSIGGNSIAAATVVHRFRLATGRDIPINAIYECPTIRELAATLSQGQHRVSLVKTLIADSRLADNVYPPVSPILENCVQRHRCVFLTGATGFLGAYLLVELLKIKEVKWVVCLVRAPSDAVALIRLQHALKRYLLWDACMPLAHKLRALAGSLEDYQFGLSNEAFDDVVRTTNVIYHLGAQVKYVEPYSAHRPANVTGTLNILRLAATSPPKSLHYVSSVVSYGPVGLTQPKGYVPEDAPLLPYVDNMDYDLGYSQSQWVAEEMVRRAMARGIRASVYRPGHILGDTQRGIGNNEDFVARLVQGCTTIGAWPRLPNQSKLFVPVDYVVSVLLCISGNPHTLGRCYNIVPPEDTQPNQVDISGLLSLLREQGCELTELPYQEWVERLENSKDVSTNRLLPLLPILKEATHGGLSPWELYENMPTYRTSNTEWGIRVSGDKELQFPAIDGRYLGKCLKVWRQM